MNQLIEKLDAQPRTTKGVILLTTPEWEDLKAERGRLRLALKEAIDEVIADGGHGHIKLDSMWLEKAQSVLNG